MQVHHKFARFILVYYYTLSEMYQSYQTGLFLIAEVHLLYIFICNRQYIRQCHIPLQNNLRYIIGPGV